jgi:hypothetical protein
MIDPNTISSIVRSPANELWEAETLGRPVAEGIVIARIDSLQSSPNLQGSKRTANN